MITGEIKSKVDAIWNAMWTGGLSNPQTVMEQLTLLLFLKGLDDAQTLAERQARARGTPVERDLFPDQLDAIPVVDKEGNKVAEGRSYADLRWPRFVTLPPAEMQWGHGACAQPAGARPILRPTRFSVRNCGRPATARWWLPRARCRILMSRTKTRSTGWATT